MNGCRVPGVGRVGQRRQRWGPVAELHGQAVVRDADRGQLQLDRRGWKQRGHVHDDLAADQLHGRRGDRQQVGQLDVGGVQQRAGVLPADLDVIGMEHEGLRIAQHDRAAQFDRHPRAAAAHLGVHRQRAVVERESKAAQGRIVARTPREHHRIEQRRHVVGRHAHRTADGLQRVGRHVVEPDRIARPARDQAQRQLVDQEADARRRSGSRRGAGSRWYRAGRSRAAWWVGPRAWRSRRRRMARVPADGPSPVASPWLLRCHRPFRHQHSRSSAATELRTARPPPGWPRIVDARSARTSTVSSPCPAGMARPPARSSRSARVEFFACLPANQPAMPVRLLFRP